MSDEPEEESEELIEACAVWLDACDAQVDAEISHDKDPCDETAEKLEEASGEVESAQNLVLDLIREKKNTEETPYRGAFRP